MSLRFHPERNIIICGLPPTGVGEIGRGVARRVRRPFVDLQAEAARRMAVAGPWPWASSRRGADENNLMLAVDRYLLRSSQVLALACADPVPPGLYMLIRERCYIVFVDQPLEHLAALEPAAGGNGDSDGLPARGGWAEVCAQLNDCDLYLGPGVLPPQLYPKLIIHCFYS